MYAIACALCVLTLTASAVFAQNGTTAPPSPPSTETRVPSPSPSPVDPQKLPVSIDRIRLQLSQESVIKPSDVKMKLDVKLKIEETVQVVGAAPPIQLWDPETAKLAFGPVPYGAPTHRDFIDLNTPEEFKRYPMDLNALMRWLMEQLNKKPAE